MLNRNTLGRSPDFGKVPMLREGGQRMVLCPYTPDTNLFGYGEGIVDFAVLSIFLRPNEWASYYASPFSLKIKGPLRTVRC